MPTYSHIGRRLCHVRTEADYTAGTGLLRKAMDIDVVDIVAILANVGVIASIVFLAIEIRQNNRFLAAQARYSLRQYRSDIIDTLITPHVMDALHKHASGQETTPMERSTAMMTALKALELWEWQWGEHVAGLLQLRELPVANWRILYHGEGPLPLPIADLWPQRRSALNPEFVRFFEDNVIDFRQRGRDGNSVAAGG